MLNNPPSFDLQATDILLMEAQPREIRIQQTSCYVLTTTGTSELEIKIKLGSGCILFTSHRRHRNDASWFELFVNSGAQGVSVLRGKSGVKKWEGHEQ
ncbi:hypothetical protein SprV_0100281500 [Sparganum proliferum]